MCLGPVPLSLEDISSALFSAHNNITSADAALIVRQIRLPRILLAAFVGAALAGSGIGFQSLLRNDLADPYILGISSGASTMVAAASIAGLAPRLAGVALPIAAFGGGFITLLIVLGIAKRNRRIDARSLLLAGVIVSAFLSALELSALRLAGYNFDQILNWLMGSLASATWQDIWLVAPLTIICLIALTYLSPSMNLYSLGEESAQQLGLDAEQFKKAVIFVSTVLAAATVAAVGIIGFIGLTAPHIARRLMKTADHRFTIIIAALCGAIMLVWSDTGARVLLGGDLLPVGAITAFLGAPFFCYLLRRR